MLKLMVLYKEKSSRKVTFCYQQLERKKKIKVVKCPHLQKVSNSCNKKDIVTFLNFPGWTLLRFSVFQIFNSKIGKLSGPDENSIS